MPSQLRIAPRVILYTQGAAPPHLEADEIALPRLPPAPGAAAAFGDGSHPTTRLCAGALDLLCRRQPGAAVLDVGTGTGVLARIARARRAGRIVATDIDPKALQCARAHAALDEHPVPIELSAAGPDSHGGSFDLVVANILEEPLRMLAPALYAALRPGGCALLSGITRPQAPALRLACQQAGLVMRSQAQLDDWVLLSCGRD
jgi:ribosomal protein L11 methyltransferase